LQEKGGKVANNYNFFMKTDVSPYIGEWIAICDKKIVSHGFNAKKVFENAKAQYPDKRTLITKVPEKGTMIF
jgi:hypothetical protein